MAIHPKPRVISERELAPSVHWASAHRNLFGSDIHRRIYDFELLYIVHGELRVQIGERNENFVARTGGLLLLPSAIRHRISGLAAPHSALLGIHFDFFDEREVAADRDIIVSEPVARDDPFCFLPVGVDGLPIFAEHYPDAPPEAVRLMEAAIEEFAAGKPGYSFACRGLLLQIFAALLRLRNAPAPVPATLRYGAAMRETAAEMAREPGRDWSNAEEAARLYLSEDHYIRLFKRCIGVSPQRYLSAVRNREACRLLGETDIPIERIGRHVGYEPHRFSHAFKRWQGMSPRDYRRHRQSNPT